MKGEIPKYYTDSGGCFFMLEILRNEDFGMVRLLEEDDRILFCAADAARALGYTNARAAVAQHCRGVVKCDIPHP